MKRCEPSDSSPEQWIWKEGWPHPCVWENGYVIGEWKGWHAGDEEQEEEEAASPNNGGSMKGRRKMETTSNIGGGGGGDIGDRER